MSTAPVKSLPAFASVTSPVPASSSVVPPTRSASPCSIAPPLLCATSAPATSVLPRSSLPVLVAVHSSTDTVPTATSTATAIATLPQVISTAPTKPLQPDHCANTTL